MLVKTRIDWTHGQSVGDLFRRERKKRREKKGGKKSTHPLFHSAREVFPEIPVLLFGREYVANGHSTIKLNARLKSASYICQIFLHLPLPFIPHLTFGRQLRDPTETGCHHDDDTAHSAQDAIKFLPFQSPFFGKRECVAGRRLIRHARSRPKGRDKHHHHHHHHH